MAVFDFPDDFQTVTQEFFGIHHLCTVEYINICIDFILSFGFFY